MGGGGGAFRIQSVTDRGPYSVHIHSLGAGIAQWLERRTRD